MKRTLGLVVAIGLSSLASGAGGYQYSTLLGGSPKVTMPEGMTHQSGMVHQSCMHHEMMNQDMMKGMMESHHEMADIVSRLAADLESLAKETDVSAIHSTLKKDRSLVERLQSKMEDRQEMMGRMMEHMENCPMMGSSADSGAPSSR